MINTPGNCSVHRWASLTMMALVGSAAAQITVTGTNQTGAVPLTPAWSADADSLLSGLAPTTATGNFGLYTNGDDHT